MLTLGKNHYDRKKTKSHVHYLALSNELVDGIELYKLFNKRK
ncbi:MAG: hypothetical protein ACI9UD_002069 [Glaciecola sp.]|jgi:hypothetical protein